MKNKLSSFKSRQMMTGSTKPMLRTRRSKRKRKLKTRMTIKAHHPKRKAETLQDKVK